MEIPQTVRDALADVPVDGATALEAGAGVGNGTAGLVDAGAAPVYAVTDHPDHAAGVRERVPEAEVVESDLQSIPLDDDSVDVILAHGLFNVLTNKEAAAIAAEFTRVAAPGAWLLVDDYDPMPEHAPIRRLFGVENAIAELVDGRPAYVFHPEAGLRQLFAGHGWDHERTKSLLEPVPWPEELFEAHLDAARRSAEPLDDALAEPLLAEAESLLEDAPSPTSRMYSLGLRHSTQ